MGSRAGLLIVAAAAVGVAATVLVMGGRRDRGAERPGDDRLEAIERRLEAIEARLEAVPAPVLAPKPAPVVAPARPQPESAPPASAPRSAGAPPPRAGSASPKPEPSTATYAWEKATSLRARYLDVEHPEGRAAALAEMRQALDGRPSPDARAALVAIQRLGPDALPAAEWRPLVEPYLASPDASVRLDALTAATTLGGTPSLVSAWTEAVRSADRSNAERAVQGLVKAADGLVEGPVADAVLDVLADGRDVVRAFVVRGLQGFVRMDDRVLARILAIADAVPTHDYDNAYVWAFIAPKFDPVPEAVLDCALRTVERGGPAPWVFQRFGKALDDRQKARVAAVLLEVLDRASNGGQRVSALALLARFAARQDVGALRRYESDADENVQAAARKAVAAAESR